MLLLLTALTDGTGACVFKEVEPGDYAVVEVNRDRFPSSLSDYDNIPESDVGDGDTKINKLITVTLKPGKDEEDNNFVDDYDGAISGPVRSDQGNPLANLMLELFKGSSQPCWFCVHRPMLEGKTGSAASNLMTMSSRRPIQLNLQRT